MPAPTFLILPALEGGEAIVATPSASGYAAHRISTPDVPDLDVKDPICQGR